MATPSDIKWGAYKQYEGPFYHGKCLYHLPAQPREQDLIINVITATEGGRYDAMNLYDRCILSSGLIQWCEAGQYSVSDMIGKVADAGKLHVARWPDGVAFKKNAKGRYRFFHPAMGEVDTTPEQKELFWKGSGLKGEWTTESRAHAKNWAATVATIWEDPEAQAIQVDYTATRLNSFILPESKKILDSAPATPVARAMKAAFLSFAANNPTWASKHFVIGANNSGTPWTQDWMVGVLKQLTFGPQITIYPIRYNAIRKVLEPQYGINLPDLATELAAWQKANDIPYVYSTSEIQDALINLGYDLGPAGVSGVYDSKTIDAVMSFEQTNGVPDPDGFPDPIMVRKLGEALEARGAAALGGSIPNS
jgi:hypothetical protein